MTNLGAVQPDVWYKASEFVGVVELKETHIKELLSDLYEQGKIETTGKNCIEKWTQNKRNKKHTIPVTIQEKSNLLIYCYQQLMRSLIT